MNTASNLRAQESSPGAAQPAQEQRATGSPEKGSWTFDFDAGLGAFGFNNSLYTNSRPDPSGDLSDNWLESYIKPAVSVDFGQQRGSTLYAKASVVGEGTFSAPPTLVGGGASSLHVEDLYLGWRSGTSIDLGEDALELTIGRAPYVLGNGLLLSDGAGDGGSRGGFWSAARKAWEGAGIGRYKAHNHTFELFYLDRDELPEAETGSKVSGANYEWALAKGSTLGLTYLKVSADEDVLPLRDGMNVYDVRATAVLDALPAWSFELEYAREDNGDAMESTDWTAQAGYELSNMAWKPRFSYRYAFFEGDDPGTAKSEAFDALFPGLSDWGTWFQGEIAGEFFLANSNLVSHQLRLHVTPSDALSGGVIAYAFRLDQPGTFAPGVTSDDIAFELDGYLDWAINAHFTASFVLAYADPHAAVEQGFGRTDAFDYGMAYLSYAY